jgi:hypothetical protein
LIEEYYPPPVSVTDGTDNYNGDSDKDENTYGVVDEVQDFSRKYTLDNNGLPSGWMEYKTKFVDSKYSGSVSHLWKAWHEEGVDIKERSKNGKNPGMLLRSNSPIIFPLLLTTLFKKLRRKG